MHTLASSQWPHVTMQIFANRHAVVMKKASLWCTKWPVWKPRQWPKFFTGPGRAKTLMWLVELEPIRQPGSTRLRGLILCGRYPTSIDYLVGPILQVKRVAHIHRCPNLDFWLAALFSVTQGKFLPFLAYKKTQPIVELSINTSMAHFSRMQPCICFWAILESPSEVQSLCFRWGELVKIINWVASNVTRLISLLSPFDNKCRLQFSLNYNQDSQGLKLQLGETITILFD